MSMRRRSSPMRQLNHIGYRDANSQFASKTRKRYSQPVRVACFERDHRTSIGAVTDVGIVDLAPLLAGDEPQAMLERLIDHGDQLSDVISALCQAGPAHPLDSVTL